MSCSNMLYNIMITIYFNDFQNNLVRNNVGGLYIRADSRGSATSLRGWIHNNLFYANHDLPCLKVEGKHSDISVQNKCVLG